MPSYHITEPHPSLPPSHIFHSGRGGAGNYTRVTPSSITPGATATGPPSRIKLTPPPSTAIFASGRGGAGNMRAEKERAMFSFDEELAAQERLREHAAPVYHIGRGGAGNCVDEMGPRKMRRMGSESSQGSSGSEREGGNGVRRSVEGAFEKLTKTFSRHSHA